jgi:hypothetical protein
VQIRRLCRYADQLLLQTEALGLITGAQNRTAFPVLGYFKMYRMNKPKNRNIQNPISHPMMNHKSIFIFSAA